MADENRTGDNDTSERAKEMLVYGPIGLAMYLRDTAPSFLRLFVDRGRTELDQRRQGVGERLDQARAMGESATASGAPQQILRLVSEGLDTLRERAGDALEALGIQSPGAASPGPGSSGGGSSGPSSSDGPTGDQPSDLGSSSESPSPSDERGVVEPTAPVSWADRVAAGASAEHLAIAAYDDLSASQIVDRLEGLSGDELVAIRGYELGHRARNTVLGKIEQLAPSG